MIPVKQFVEQAKKHLNEAYVYGCKHEVLTRDKYYSLQRTYGKTCVWDSDINKVGQYCCDCSGLIYIALKECGVAGWNISSYQFYEKATTKQEIVDNSKIPYGALVWMKGHIGIYIGNNQYLAEDGSAHGCRIAPMYKNKFTHYLLLENVIEYENVPRGTIKEDSMSKQESSNTKQEVKKLKVKFNGNIKEIDTVTINGNNYFKAQDLNDHYLHTEYDQVSRMVTIECRA